MRLSVLLLSLTLTACASAPPPAPPPVPLAPLQPPPLAWLAGLPLPAAGEGATAVDCHAAAPVGVWLQQAVAPATSAGELASARSGLQACAAALQAGYPQQAGWLALIVDSLDQRLQAVRNLQRTTDTLTAERRSLQRLRDDHARLQRRLDELGRIERSLREGRAPP